MGDPDLNTTQPFGATPALRQALQDLGETRAAAAGTLLFGCGDVPRGVFLLLEGRVKLTLEDHGLHYARTVGAGSVLGLPSTMCAKPYSLTARTLDPLQYVFVASNVVKEFLRTRPDLCFQVVEILAREVREMRHATEEVVVSAAAR
jgi:CRP-like cAMP-binding protein